MWEWFNHHMPVFIGVFLGTLAHFGKRIADEDIPSAAHVIGFVMQLGLIALLSAQAVEFIGIEGSTGKMTAAGILTVSGQEVIQWVKRVGWRRILNADEIERD